MSRSTIRRILKEQGIEPAPERSKHMPWKKFLKMHWESLAAADFFTVEIWTRVGLMRSQFDEMMRPVWRRLRQLDGASG